MQIYVHKVFIIKLFLYILFSAILQEIQAKYYSAKMKQNRKIYLMTTERMRNISSSTTHSI